MVTGPRQVTVLRPTLVPAYQEGRRRNYPARGFSPTPSLVLHTQCLALLPRQKHVDFLEIAAVKRIRHKSNSQGQILALACR